MLKYYFKYVKSRKNMVNKKVLYRVWNLSVWKQNNKLRILLRNKIFNSFIFNLKILT